MNKFFSFIIRQSAAIVLAVIFVIAFGIYSAVQTPINLLPDINVPMVCVQVIYAGANAQSVERDVTGKLEEGLSAIGGVTSVDSYSYDNLSAVVLSFDYGTDAKEKQGDIKDKVGSLELPEGVEISVYDIDLNAEALAVLSLTSEKGLDDAYSKGKQLASRLSAIDGVESVEIKGGAEYSYCVRTYGGLELIAPLIVEAFSYGGLDIPLGNLSSENGEVQIRNNSDINTADDIKNMPIELPEEVCNLFAYIRGQIIAGLGGLFDINDPAAAETVAENPMIFGLIKQRIVEGGGGNLSDEVIKLIIKKPFEENKAMVLAVSDVASVTKEPHYSSYVYYFNGKLGITPGVTLEIYKSNGANSSSVVEKVKSAYASVSSEEGYSAQINLLDDQSQFISESISNVLVSMLIGCALAVVVIFVFLKKVKTSLIIAVTMPLSVLASIICLFAMGITLNMVSLGGLAVGIGMLVDNSIVVIESVSKHRDMDKSAYRAAVDGTTEVGGALFGSTITTVCVFIPILFAGGLTAEIFTDLSWAVIFSLSLSLIVAVTVIPALYAMLCNDKRMLKGGGLSKSLPGQITFEEIEKNSSEVAQDSENSQPVSKKSSFAQKLASLKEPKIMNATEKFYGGILSKVLKRKIIPILTAAIVFSASIGLLFLTGTEFLPSIDKGQIEVTMSYDSGEALENIQSDVSAFACKIEEDFKDNIDYISVSVGKNGLLALTNTGIITVQLNTNRGTDGVVNAIRSLGENDAEKLPGRNVSVKQIDGVVASLMSGSDDLSVTILGEDGETLKSIANEIVVELEKPENGFKDVKSTATDRALQTDIKFDRRKLAGYGLDYQTVVLTLRIGMASYAACTATIDGEECSVNVSFDKNSIKDASQLKDFPVGYNPDGTAIKLSQVAEVSEPQEVEACIRHSGGRQMISVSAALPGVDTGSAGKQMRKIAADVLQKYEGYDFQQSGISSYLNDAFSGLAVALVISFFLLFAVMTVQFGSAVKALIIMASIPFSFTGGFIALVITGTSLNVVSFIGLIMLMGVVVNNAIVMLEKIKQLHLEGMPHYFAVQKACRVRLRPIFMTTLTTILALIPLAIGVGKGSELMQPLGIVVIGGLLIGTLVTLILVPAVYCAVYRLSEKFPEGKKRSSQK